MTYAVYGDYGYESENMLYETASLKGAINWAQKYCRYDLGGYNCIEVVHFADDGEVVTDWAIYTEEEEYV